MSKTSEKTAVSGKYVNEVSDGNIVDDSIVSRDYSDQVVETIKA